ncbi:SulP family inorganic anion transporter [Paraoerskovia marina]|uniref:SulP family inorganic anion transporter n=1 Tax=Paraoerskovia marina TaxID=545619 RepID=UPI0009DDC1E9|nr:SulP family inorganic anion transporter [Paraoerskovia marina]
MRLGEALRGGTPRKDVIAGLTVWAVLVPEALAYATIAGVDPVVGLYAAVPSLILYSVFGTSRRLVVGPMAASAALSAAVVGALHPGDDAAFLALTTGAALVTGLLCIVAGVARLGVLASFVSEPVLKGFIIGMAIVIIVGQVPKLLGLDSVDGNAVEKTIGVFGELGDIHGASALLGIAALALALSLRRWAPKVPGALVVVAAGVLVSVFLGLGDQGVEIVGHIEPGIPTLGLPDLALSDYSDLLVPALGIMAVAFAESLGAARSSATTEKIDANRELIGMGMSNIGSGLAGGMVVNGSLSKTAVNSAAGGTSQWSSIVAGILTLATLLFLTPLFEPLPEPVLAAVVIAAVLELVDIKALVRLWKLATPLHGVRYGGAARSDFWAAAATLLGVLLIDTLPGLVIGVIISILLLLSRASKPHIAELGQTGDLWVDTDRATAHGRSTTPHEGMVVLRVEGGMFFANSTMIEDFVEARVDKDTRAVVLDAQTVPFVDVTAAKMLVELRDSLQSKGVTLYLTRDVGQVRDLIRNAEPSREFMPHVVPDVHAAVAAFDESEKGTSAGGTTPGSTPDA